MTKEELENFYYNPEIEEVINGEVYCKKCGKQISQKFDMLGMSDKPRIFRVACACIEEEEKRITQEIDTLNKMRRMKELRGQSSIGRRYSNATFDNAIMNRNEDFDKAMERCKKYCDNYDIAAEKGLGLYIYGSSGVGKTHLAACIANELLKKCVPVLVTNFYEVSKAIKETYNGKGSESKLINQFANIDFLMLDDIGTEVVRKNGQDNWLQEKIFEVTNKRYNEMKPTIFTSNYSIEQLSIDRGIMEKTTDRIAEMSSLIMKIEGKSVRR